MIRAALPLLLAPLLALSACMPATTTGFAPTTETVALQRMRFVVEAVCLNNTSRQSQDRAARALGFPIRERRDGGINFVNPGTLTFLRLGPAPEQRLNAGTGAERRFTGSGCSVGSPAVDLTATNRIVGEILAPRLVEGDRTVSAPLGAGRNAGQGVGLFFDDLAITVPFATTIIGDPASGQGRRFDHPVILIVHN
ncbi:hypothetical protein [Jannaschia sp. LMIT008]|uniref:hypothetical protein n=1 Tax=Jannaschia maritima TaxID=3032585 RepID=UPI002810B552|nr:hypothetical protein [Jannaschia sp. LMIT008]